MTSLPAGSQIVVAAVIATVAFLAFGPAMDAGTPDAASSAAGAQDTQVAQGPGRRGGRGGTRGVQPFPPFELGGPTKEPPPPPPPPVWPADPLPAGPISLDTAEYHYLRAVVIARGLDDPWSLAFLPDGSLLVTERVGRIRIIRKGVLEPVHVAGGPNPIWGRSPHGLMDLVLHPEFAKNNIIYIAYHRPVSVRAANAPPDEPAPTAPTAGALTLARGTWDGTAIRNLTDIFQTTVTGAQSRIAFGRDRMLYMTVSAPVDENLKVAQDPTTYSGKVVRLHDDGSIPTDNPFAGRAGHLPGIFTMGHRDMHALQVNPETGEMWATEQAPNGGDELNILRPGRNYGWPVVSHGRTSAGPRISENPSRPEFEQPYVYWVPSIGLTGMTFYTGETFTKWKRNVFVTGLRQGEMPRTGQLQRIEFNDKWEEIRREPLLRELGHRLRDVRQGPDGWLYILTAENTTGAEGAVLRIEPADGPTGTPQ